MRTVLDVGCFRGNVNDNLVSVGRGSPGRLRIQVGLGHLRHCIGAPRGKCFVFRCFRGNIVSVKLTIHRHFECLYDEGALLRRQSCIDHQGAVVIIKITELT